MTLLFGMLVFVFTRGLGVQTVSSITTEPRSIFILPCSQKSRVECHRDGGTYFIAVASLLRAAVLSANSSA
jgi:hypothetical protein